MDRQGRAWPAPPMIEFIRRVVAEAAWPGIVVLVAHAVLGELFGHEPYVDPAMHFLGGLAAAFFFMRLPRLLPGLLGEPTPAALCLLGGALQPGPSEVRNDAMVLGDTLHACTFGEHGR